MKIDQLINKEYPLDKNYIPNDLIETDDNKNNFHKYKDPNETPKISAKIYPFFIHMQKDALKDGYKLIVDSGYRSYSYQEMIWNKSIKEKGIEETKKYLAFPGTSEHQSGLAIDIACLRGEKNTYDDNIKEGDPEVKWLINNSYKYGFILRYPKNKEFITGINYEPWHYRFVGIELATFLKEQNLTLEEYYEEKTI